MAIYDAAVEIGSTDKGLVWIVDLAGCAAPLDPGHEAVTEAAGAVTSFLCWLKSRGEPVSSRQSEVEIRVVETQCHRGNITRSGPRGLFTADRRPLTARHLHDGLRFLEYSRQSLRALCLDLDPEQMKSEPPSGGFSINQHIRHVANMERWCMGRLGPVDQVQPVSDPLVRLDRVRELVVGRLTALSAEDRFAVVIVDSESWTARKVIRRLIWHERHHTRAIREILSHQADPPVISP